MPKPAEQWETARAVAYPAGAPDDARFEGDARAQRFELRFRDGRVGHASFGLEVQLADAVAAEDPDVGYAARAWLAARGQRRINLHRVVYDTAHGRALAELPLAVQPFSVHALSALPSAVPPRRLITLCPSNTELVGALGCIDRVIACDASSDHPAETARLERLGHDLAPDLARIAALAPDLVISSLTVPGMERVVTGLHARGIPQLVLAPASLSDVRQGAAIVAQALGVPERGEALIQQLERERDALHARAAARPPARVYLEWWPKPMFTPGRDCYSNELIALAGGVNVFAERAGASVRIEAEELLRAAPDVCFVSWCGVRADKLDPARLIQRAGLEGLEAARAGRVFPLDEAFSGRPGPRMLEAARIMARAIDEARG